MLRLVILRGKKGHFGWFIDWCSIRHGNSNIRTLAHERDKSISSILGKNEKRWETAAIWKTYAIAIGRGV